MTICLMHAWTYTYVQEHQWTTTIRELFCRQDCRKRPACALTLMHAGIYLHTHDYLSTGAVRDWCVLATYMQARLPSETGLCSHTFGGYHKAMKNPANQMG